MSEVLVYETNGTLGAIARDLKGASRVLVLTHTKPDGDAIGSTLGLARSLRAVGVDATVVYAGFYPDRYRSVLREGEALLDPDETGDVYEDARASGAERVVICDTGARMQLKSALGFLEGKAPITTIVDHHRSGDPDLARTRHIDTSAAAACVSVAELCAEIMGVDAARFPVEIATALYLGLGTDTGWFRYSNTDPRALRLAADLLGTGVDAESLVRMSECGDAPERLELLRRGMNALRLFADQQGALMTLRASDITESGVDPGDTGGLVDIARSVRTVRVSALCVEQGNGLVKVSMRSVGGAGSVDVAEIANRLGGGGHIHAAGARVQGTLEDVAARVEALLTDALA